MDFQRVLQGPQQVIGGADTYAPPTLGVGQGFYTVESLEKSQPQIFQPANFAYHSSDGTVPPGSYGGIAMQAPQQDHGMPFQAVSSEYASYGSSEYGIYLSLHSRVAPGSMAAPRYGLEDHYVPSDVHNPWRRNEAQNASSGSASGLFQQSSSFLAYASAAESEPAREYSGLPLSYLGLSSTNSQVLNSGSTGSAKKKIASQPKTLFAATRKNRMQPPKPRVPTVSGPGAPGWCSVCEIECNSKEVLEQHCLGRKHKKKLEKKDQLLAAQMNPKEKNTQRPGSGNLDKSLKRENQAGTQALSDNGLLKSRNQEPSAKLHRDKNIKAGGEAEAEQSNSTPGKRKQKIATDDIGTKRQRLLDAGTDISAVKVCRLCNTVCNSQIVFDAHLAGKKHASQVKKLEEEANPFPQVNKLEDPASSVLQGEEEEANVTSQGEEANGKEFTADGELDHKDGKAD